MNIKLSTNWKNIKNKECRNCLSKKYVKFLPKNIEKLSQENINYENTVRVENFMEKVDGK